MNITVKTEKQKSYRVLSVIISNEIYIIFRDIYAKITYKFEEMNLCGSK